MLPIAPHISAYESNGAISFAKSLRIGPRRSVREWTNISRYSLENLGDADATQRDVFGLTAGITDKTNF